MPAANPLLVAVVVVVAVVGLIALAQSFMRCLWYFVAPLLVVIALVLLYDWFLKK